MNVNISLHPIIILLTVGTFYHPDYRLFHLTSHHTVAISGTQVEVTMNIRLFSLLFKAFSQYDSGFYYFQGNRCRCVLWTRWSPEGAADFNIAHSLDALRPYGQARTTLKASARNTARSVLDGNLTRPNPFSRGTSPDKDVEVDWSELFHSPASDYTHTQAHTHTYTHDTHSNYVPACACEYDPIEFPRMLSHEVCRWS